MISNRTNPCTFLSNITDYLLNLIFLSLLLFINTCEARGSMSNRRESSGICPRFSFAQVYIRDPLDCNIFYICFGRRFWKLSCPGDTVFSSKHNVCVWSKSRKDDCQYVKEKIILSSVTAPILTSSRNAPQKTKPNKLQKTVTSTTTMTIQRVTGTITEMMTARRISKSNLLTTVKRDIETEMSVKSTATFLTNGDATTKTIQSRITVRPTMTTGRTLSTKRYFKLKTKLFPPYWTRNEHVTKWWQRKTIKWGKKEKQFTKETTKTTKPTRRGPTIPKNEMGK